MKPQTLVVSFLLVISLLALAGERFVVTAETLPDLTIAHIEVTQAIQNLTNSVPLVADRPTVIRVYAQTSGTTPVDGVSVQLAASRSGFSLPNSPLVIGPSTVPPTPSRGVYSSTFNTLLPSTWITGTITITATVDHSNTIAESNENNNTVSIALRFIRVPRLKLTIIPYVYTHTPTGKVYAQPIEDPISEWLFRRYPLSGIDVSLHAPVSFVGNLSETGEWYRLFDSVAGLKQAEGAPPSEVYFGIVSWGDSIRDYWGGTGTPIAGLGAANRIAVGLDQSRVVYIPEAIAILAAHEISHCFGRGHADDDPNYPYANGSIGQYGVDVVDQRLYSPENTHDITCVSCSIGGFTDQWVSDYTYIGLYQNQVAYDPPEKIYLPLITR